MKILPLSFLSSLAVTHVKQFDRQYREGRSHETERAGGIGTERADKDKEQGGSIRQEGLGKDIIMMERGN